MKEEKLDQFLRNALGQYKKEDMTSMIIRRCNGVVRSTVTIKDDLVKVSGKVPRSFSCEYPDGHFEMLFSLSQSLEDACSQILSYLHGIETLANMFCA